MEIKLVLNLVISLLCEVFIRLGFGKLLSSMEITQIKQQLGIDQMLAHSGLKADRNGRLCVLFMQIKWQVCRFNNTRFQKI